VVNVHDNVMPLVHPDVQHTESFERAHHHLGVLVPVKGRRRADDGPVCVAGVVEDCAAS
jgi:hypothetical protein